MAKKGKKSNSRVKSGKKRKKEEKKKIKINKDLIRKPKKKKIKKAKEKKKKKKVEKIKIKKRIKRSKIRKKIDEREEVVKRVKKLLADPDARRMLVDAGGENALEIILNLPYISNDEDLSKKLNVKISDVRSALNRLHNIGVTYYIRDKNQETGWFYYTWKLREDKLKEWLEQKEKEVFYYEEGKEYYFCRNCNIYLEFDEAFDYEFKCPYCKIQLEYLERKKIIH